MDLKNLAIIIEGENRVAKYFNDPLIDINALTKEDAKRLQSRLESNLSPEVLYQDGERSHAEAMRYQRLYIAAQAELKNTGLI